jgi:hypothetical protein
VRRRDFIACVGFAFASPVRARAQQADRARRIGVLLPFAEDDPEAKSHLSAITEGLKRLGWSQDRNIRIDARFAAGIADQYSLLAKPQSFVERSLAIDGTDWPAHVVSFRLNGGNLMQNGDGTKRIFVSRHSDRRGTARATVRLFSAYRPNCLKGK